MYTANAPLYRPPGATDRISHATNTTQKQRHIEPRTYHTRTDRTKYCEIAVLWTQHRHLRVSDSVACIRPMHPSTAPLGRRTAFATLPIPHKEQRHKEPRTDTHRPHKGLRDRSPVDSAPVPTATRLGILTGDATLHPASRDGGPHRPHNYYHTQNRHASPGQAMLHGFAACP